MPTELPYRRRHVVCECGVVIQQGDTEREPYVGLCSKCSLAKDWTRKRAEQQMQLRKLKRPAQSKESLEKSDPFGGFQEGEEEG